ncbi:hypothetical protein Gogos_021653 [Gossypium gossypioides]|uniref:DUF4283 domain-containing protein n=1 Tax=Gossypium gossypioides TaxID=34282 RepID=A0A7J9CX85_GOSGO|nr:hypothetical protein [Gossypium gossypioides]
MEDAMEDLTLMDDEDDAFQEDEGAVGQVNQLCLVGRCLTDSVVHFSSLRNTLADLWHPIGGICITEIGEKRRRNMKVSRWLRAIDGSPYSEKNLAGVMYGNSRGSGRNSNPNLIPLGPDPIQVDGRLVKKQDGCIDNLTTNGLVQGE